jgi:inorganic triphosphatase YgiF
MAAAADETIEIERKYEVGAGFTVPALDGVPGVGEVAAPRRYRLTAIYFDTAGLALANARVTLRRRTGGTDAGWHLKLPKSAESRREVHAPLGSNRAVVPPRLLALVSEWVHGQPVRPIARLQTSRTVRRLLGDSGAVLAEVADDRVAGSVPGAGTPDAMGMAWQTVVSWRELEVELVTGTAALLDAAGEQLCEAGAKPSSAASKLSVVLAAADPLRKG